MDAKVKMGEVAGGLDQARRKIARQKGDHRQAHVRVFESVQHPCFVWGLRFGPHERIHIITGQPHRGRGKTRHVGLPLEVGPFHALPPTAAGNRRQRRAGKRQHGNRRLRAPG